MVREILYRDYFSTSKGSKSQLSTGGDPLGSCIRKPQNHDMGSVVLHVHLDDVLVSKVLCRVPRLAKQGLSLDWVPLERDPSRFHVSFWSVVLKSLSRRHLQETKLFVSSALSGVLS